MDSMDWLYIVKLMQVEMRDRHFGQNHQGAHGIIPCQHPTCQANAKRIEEITATFIRPAQGSFPRDVIAELRTSLQMVNSALQMTVLMLKEMGNTPDGYAEELCSRLTEADRMTR